MTRILAFVVLAAALPALPQAPGKPARSVDELKTFYAQSCVRCHGADGSATDADGKRLKGADFTDPKAMTKEKDASLAKTILKGTFFGLGMPAFKDQLSPEEAQAMVAEVLRKAQKGKVIAAQAAPGQAAPGQAAPK